MSELETKIRAKMDAHQLAALATIAEDGKPWVRYVTPVMDQDMNIWLATSAGSRKVAQLRRNPEVHLVVGVTSPETAESYLQVQGKAQILTDKATKERVWFEQLKGIFAGPDDPNYVVVKITPYRIEYQGMGMVPPVVWTA